MTAVCGITWCGGTREHHEPEEWEPGTLCVAHEADFGPWGVISEETISSTGAEMEAPTLRWFGGSSFTLAEAEQILADLQTAIETLRAATVA